jgi:hypothetical protein
MLRSLTFLALVVVPALGFSLRDISQNNGAEAVSDLQQSPQNTNVRNIGTRRDLKGSGSKGSKGGSCETISVYTLPADYSTNGQLLGGYAQIIEGLPVYEKGTHKIIATITETVIDSSTNENKKSDCTSTGAINFGLKNDNDKRTRNQLTFQGTCTGGLTNALTGGTGEFSGAKGVMDYKGEQGNRLLFELQVC